MTEGTPMTAAPDAPPAPEFVRPPSGDRWFERLPQWLLVVALGAAFLIVWQGIISVGLMSRIILASPGDTAREIVILGQGILQFNYVFDALKITVFEVVIGFILAAIFGFVLGTVVGETRIGQKAVMPYLIGFNALPKVAFAPVFVAWLGFGAESKIVMALFIAFFPVIVDTAAGLASVDRDSIALFRSFQASRWKTLTMLKLPAAMPFIFAGLKTAAVFSVVGAVIGEYLGGGKGLGELIRVSSQQMRMDQVFALIFFLSLAGLALFGVVGWLERRLVFWHRPDPVGTVSA